ncbi:DNA polymerase III subunit alpha [Lentilactobacillus sp. Marseille-Q4993]|uniref:DNA polymerase III subunit alpha n=1 Tax=Lentilactobacillus sp. Marseille-Q4993 TaxID=3039492 RepID=UPI0024BCEA44|nr:DNA polymerase III subunit alpha [Lentilactobacillus sp. Marseille-Q4993]
MSFVPLNVRSSYSLLQSPVRIKDLVSTAKQLGYHELALTDVNVMYGAVEFYNQCLANGIKPIIGMALTISGIVLEDKEYQLLLLAKSAKGYQNLMKISSIRQIKPDSNLSEYQGLFDDVYVILPSGQEAHDLVFQGRSREISTIVDSLVNNGVDQSLIRIGLDFHVSDSVADVVQKTAASCSIKVVAESPVLYLRSQDFFLKQVLNAIGQGEQISDPATKAKQAGESYLRPEVEITGLYRERHFLAAIKETESIASDCNVEIKKQQPDLPRFKTPNGETATEYLASLCRKGLGARLATDDVQNKQPYEDRLNHELATIHSMGFDDYFLIVRDVIAWAHEHDIITGPGRGSAAGSLVAYVLQITDVDPIKYDLLFERFLNPERVQMPDIDLDIPDTRRDEIIKYVQHAYGNDRVAQIITFGTLGAKQAIRDVARTFGLNVSQQDKWSKAIPNAIHVTLRDAYSNSMQLQTIVKSSSLNEQLFKVATQLEGLPRHYSTHAAGVVLSDNDLVELVPVQPGNEGLLMTQYSKDYVESVGLLKMDFLGLRNLSILDDALKEVNRSGKSDLDISRVPLDDPKVIQVFDSADTAGIFQFESSGIRNVLKRLRPDSFEDIALVNALYRPGPMENIDDVIARKHGQQQITYPDDSLKPILSSTYGVIVYQEQVMLVASKLAGFTLGEADILRRAMSKKKLTVMEKMKAQFINGARHNGISEPKAADIFNYIEKFANYGFNKSHAYAYSKMAYELAFLKVHYPGQFHVALLKSVRGNAVKIKQYVTDARKVGVKVVSPDINLSDYEVSYNENQIRFGLGSIKGLRSDFVKAIISERQSNGNFKSFQNFLARIDEKFRKEDLIKALVAVGAFDGFSNNRAELLEASPEFINSINLSGNSMSLFKALEPKIPKLDEMPLFERLSLEDEYLGVYLSGHPTERYSDLSQQLHAVTTDVITNGQKNINLILYLSKVKVIRTKTGKQMAFLTGSDQVGEVSVTIFPNLFSNIQSWLHKDMVVLINGNAEKRDQLEIIANKMAPAANIAGKYRQKSTHKWYLRIEAGVDTTKVFEQLTSLANKYSGNHPVVVHEVDSKRTIELGNKLWLAASKELNDQLITILGANNVIYK